MTPGHSALLDTIERLADQMLAFNERHAVRMEAWQEQQIARARADFVRLHGREPGAKETELLVCEVIERMAVHWLSIEETRSTISNAHEAVARGRFSGFELVNETLH